jgi:CheY-like chemotaxis protein/HPt (histidine-containing phosphotransfer) domain-containing protein
MPPQVLAADDDLVSLHFLTTALHQLGCVVSAVASGTAALAACDEQEFALLLLDRCMPDLGGAALLRALRARGHCSIAIATSAELDPAIRAELRAAGYAGALAKPLSINGLARLLAEHLPYWQAPGQIPSAAAVRSATPDLLDDAAALVSVGGDAKTLRALRDLLKQELEATIPGIAAARAPMSTQELRDCLHRLRASCRYCGTPALGAAAARLAELDIDATNRQPTLIDFLDVCAQTAAALAAQGSTDAS